MQEATFPTTAGESVLLNQRIEDQATVQTAMDEGFGSEFRMLLFDHEALAFLTGHGMYLQ